MAWLPLHNSWLMKLRAWALSMRSLCGEMESSSLEVLLLNLVFDHDQEESSMLRGSSYADCILKKETARSAGLNISPDR